jgi:hypothetical protein
VKILVGPHDTCGHLGVTVRALRDVGAYARAIAYNNDPLSRNYPIDPSIHSCLNLVHKRPKIARFWKELRVACSAAREFDVFHFVYRSLMRKHRDLSLFNLLGKRSLVEFTGSPIRLVSIAAAKNKYYREFASGHAVKEQRAIQRMQMLARHIETAIVSDYELYDYVAPYFANVKIARTRFELERFVPQYPEKNKAVPLIVHIPSVKGVKGTEFVVQAIERLRADGERFDFELIHGVTYQEALGWLAKADVVIDQFLIGSYGGLAVEAMALGKPVLCYIREDLVETYPADLPIVNANIDNLQEKLSELISDNAMRHDLGLRGRAYAEKYHDSKVLAKELLKLYEEL